MAPREQRQQVQQAAGESSRPESSPPFAWLSSGGQSRRRGCAYAAFNGHPYPPLGDVTYQVTRVQFSRAAALGIKPEELRDNDVHVHVTAGAVPKDGQSAGAAMFTPLALLFTNRKVRADVAMTGEVTLRGLVLPIGGLKEKKPRRDARRDHDDPDAEGEREGSGSTCRTKRKRRSSSSP